VNSIGLTGQTSLKVVSDKPQYSAAWSRRSAAGQTVSGRFVLIWSLMGKACTYLLVARCWLMVRDLLIAAIGWMPRRAQYGTYSKVDHLGRLGQGPRSGSSPCEVSTTKSGC
jgi:hypothetical protein